MKKLLSLLLSSVFVCAMLQVRGNVVEITTAAASSNEQIVYNYLKNTLGFNTAAACGVLGNISVETGDSFSPTTFNSKENAWGICQWEGDRLTDLQSHYPSSWKTLDAQLGFLKWELEGGDYKGKATFNYLKSIDNSAEGASNAAKYFAQYFERCASASHTTRMSRAQYTFWPKYYEAPPVEYTLDVNLSVDGAAFNYGYEAVTFDVYVNDTLVANDASDYCSQHQKGSSFLVSDVRVVGCYFQQGYGDYSGSIDSDIAVTIPIITQHYPEPIPEEPASCTVSGWTGGQRCAACGSILEPRQRIDPSGHQWNEGTVTKAPTAREEGEQVFTCRICGESRTEPVPPLPYLPGDINGDGVVNSKDLTRLMKYLAGESVSVNQSSLDVNSDAAVNSKDLTRLMKYLAGENVEIY